MYSEKEDYPRRPGDPRPQLAQVRQRLLRLHLEPNLDWPSWGLDEDLHVPQAGFGQVEDGGLKELVRRRR